MKDRRTKKAETWKFDRVTMGLFINDVTQVGGGGSYFCYTIYEGPSKIVNLVWHTAGGGGQKISIFAYLRDVIYEWPPKYIFCFNVTAH